jgi:exopolyphosphatase/pppGpp-phosphohydrolase
MESPCSDAGVVVALAWFIRQGELGEHGINGEVLKAKEVEDWIPKFASLDKEGRRELPGFEPGREDVALAGLLVVGEILQWTGQNCVRVSTGGLREGRLLELLNDMSDKPLKIK